MKISMDKKYRTRDGRDVRLLCVDGPDTRNPVFGYVQHGTSPMFWSETGRAHHGGDFSDLIEYHEPDIRTIWVNVYETYVVSHPSEKEAKFLATSEAISIAQPVTFEVKREG